MNFRKTSLIISGYICLRLLFYFFCFFALNIFYLLIFCILCFVTCAFITKFYQYFFYFFFFAFYYEYVWFFVIEVILIRVIGFRCGIGKIFVFHKLLNIIITISMWLVLLYWVFSLLICNKILIFITVFFCMLLAYYNMKLKCRKEY